MTAHRMTVEATPHRPWPYRWRCSCGVEGSADSEASAAMKHAAHGGDNMTTEHTTQDGISMTVTDTGFVLSFDRPGRVEVSVDNPLARTALVAHVYEGAEVDLDQEPLFAYDGSIGKNESVAR